MAVSVRKQCWTAAAGPDLSGRRHVGVAESGASDVA